ncbi:MAG: nucleoid-associated protein [Ignavibacteriae bacterium]|nr:nucleoid-associated protein [Ignavibacteriota bacterium]
MPFGFNNLLIKRIIVHEVYQRSDNRDIVPPKYSTEFTTLDIKGIATLQERIINALGNESYSLEMQINGTNPESVFDVSTKLIASADNDFKEISKKLPLKLAQAQTSRIIPGGVVVVFDGTIGSNNKRFLGIIKAEIHSGFNIIEDDNVLSLEFLSDLLLTPQQKLYKIALFIENNSPQNGSILPENYLVFVYDHNMTKSETQQAAQYFYETFLGCTFSPSDKKLTSDFYHYTKEFFETLNIPEDTKLDLETGLYTYLKVSQNNLISVTEFADEYLEPEQKDNYSEFMFDKGLPDRQINKDITYIMYKLRRRNIKFTSDVKISSPSDNFEDLVHIISKTEDDRTIVSIKGTIKKVD